MKKAYMKPDIIFEDFTLSTSIAGSCEVPTSTPGARQCGLDFGAGVIFLDTMLGICTIKVKDNGSGDGEHNGICYHVFSNGRNIFNS